MKDAATATKGAAVHFAVSGRLESIESARLDRLLDRSLRAEPSPSRVVADLIDRVARNGDEALFDQAARFDSVELEALEIPRQAWDSALQTLDGDVRSGLEWAAERIAAFHRAQLPARIEFEPVPGVMLTRKFEPIERVGVYAPGGRAAYPSSVLMGVVPARVAGVGEIVVCSPPGTDGLPSASVLAACAIAGADRVFAIGGAGAIAALALGTRSVPRVSRIIGPGNAWVTEAKRQLQGTVAIDCPAGPSELLIVADSSTEAATLAHEIIAQAEHDPDAACVLLTTDPLLARTVTQALAAALDDQPRADVIRAALGARGGLILTATIDDALEFASKYAPEHLLLAVTEPHGAARRVRNAGTIFLGSTTSVVFGDYVTGANHVLPTGGSARSFSGLDVLDFIRWTTVQEVTPAAAARIAPIAAVLADAEGLPGHATAAGLRAQGRMPTSPPDTAPPEVPGRAATASRMTAARAPAAPRLRPAYRDIRKYDAARTPCDIDLSDNTNLFGVCPAVRAVLDSVPDHRVTRYPSPYADALRQAIAETLRVEPAAVSTGCGSDDLIDSIFRAFCEPGDAIAFPWPTFSVVPAFARMNAARPVGVEMPAGDPFDIQALLASRPRVVYVCRPDNPTGLSVPAPEIEALSNAFDGLIIVDEAYVDYADDSLLPSATTSRNVVVLRTLSKAYGMAGLRVGFVVGRPHLIAEIEKSRGPYKVGALAEDGAVAALRDGQQWVQASVRLVRQNRDRLVAELRAAGYEVPASNANFVLIPLPGRPGRAAEVAGRLREHGVGVRAFPSLPGLGDCIRVTVGPWPLVKTFLDAFGRVAGSAVESP